MVYGPWFYRLGLPAWFTMDDRILLFDRKPARNAMNIDSFRRFCLSFPQATEDMPWPDDLCFKVGGRIFAGVSLSAVPQCVTFKCTPESFAELVEREGIHPAPYVGRYKWVQIESLDVLRDHELRALLGHSYDMVAKKAKPEKPKPKKPKPLKKARRARS